MEHAAKKPVPEPAPAVGPAARIAALIVYPVKGARGIATDTAVATPTGLALPDGGGDREWMVVDPAGQFVTQRDSPRLALVTPSLARNRLWLAAPACDPLGVDLAAPPADARDVRLWRSQVRGRDAGDAAARWMSSHLVREVRLVRFDRTRPRACNPDYVGRSSASTMFADGYPVLVIASASLADLNERLLRKGVAPLPMDRFRPNLVVDGLNAYDEDHLDTLAAGETLLRMVKPCTRCKVTTIDQASAAAGVEPLPTLAMYRVDDRLAAVTFGMNAIVAQGGALTAGAPIDARFRFQEAL